MHEPFDQQQDTRYDTYKKQIGEEKFLMKGHLRPGKMIQALPLLLDIRPPSREDALIGSVGFG